MNNLHIDNEIGNDLAVVKSDGDMTDLSISKEKVSIRTLEVTKDFENRSAEYGFVSLRDDGTQDANENNFGDGSNVDGSLGESPFTSSRIGWDHTNNVWEVKRAGVYEVVADVGVSINGSFSTTLTIYINSAADTLGTAVAQQVTAVSTTDDPLPISIRWLGKVSAGEFIALTIDAGGRTPMFETGSTFRILRIN
tara:strand:- start:8 stop:592 length:585 start_codon:yes stop_codon:yes gene_type:complete